MKIRKKEYGDVNIIGKNVERLRKEKKIKQKDFISKLFDDNSLENINRLGKTDVIHSLWII